MQQGSRTPGRDRRSRDQTAGKAEPRYGRRRGSPLLRGIRGGFGYSQSRQRLSSSSDLARLATQAESYVQEMDFRFLYNDRRDVFHIGYNVDSGTLDNSYYDLLASEARIASLLAVAKGDVPQRWAAPGAAAYPDEPREPGAAFLERHDVRIPYAAPASGELSGDTAIPDCRGGHRPANRLWKAEEVCWGISESASTLSMQPTITNATARLRRARPWFQTRLAMIW